MSEMRVILPEERGVYALLILIDKPSVLKIGRLGIFKAENGLYVYVGSAMGKGPTSLRGRLSRHISPKRKKLHWHIDWLLSSPQAKVKALVYAPSKERLECSLAKAILRDCRYRVAIRGFGSSDCSCPSHLFISSYQLMEDLISSISLKFKSLGLIPHVLKLIDYGSD